MSILCGSCLKKLYRKKSHDVQSIPCKNQPNTDENNVVKIRADVASRTHAVCVVCRTTVKKGRCIKIPPEARLDLLVRFRVLSHESNRVCLSHLQGKRLDFSITWNDKDCETVSDLSCQEASDLIEQFLAYTSHMPLCCNKQPGYKI